MGLVNNTRFLPPMQHLHFPFLMFLVTSCTRSWSWTRRPRSGCSTGGLWLCGAGSSTPWGPSTSTSTTSACTSRLRQERILGCPDTRQVPNSLLVGVTGIMGSFLLWRLRCFKIPALPQWCCCTVFAFRSQFHIGVFIQKCHLCAFYVDHCDSFKVCDSYKNILLKNTLQLFLI